MNTLAEDGPVLRRIHLPPFAGSDPMTLNWLEMAVIMATDESEEILRRCAQHAAVFQREGTYAERWGIPSALVRVDYVVRNEVVHLFEIDEAPFGAGATSIMIPDPVGRRLSDWARNLERKSGRMLVVWVSPRRREGRGAFHDDNLFAQAIGCNIVSTEEILAQPDAYIVWPRAYFDENVPQVIVEASLRPIKNEGLKDYGVPMGLWKMIPRPENIPDPSDHMACKEIVASWGLDHPVVKLPRGTRSEGIYPLQMKGVVSAGGYTASRILSDMMNDEETKRLGHFYAQEFIPPERDKKLSALLAQTTLAAARNRIRRVYCGYDPLARRFRIIGGCWFARDTVIIHGASNAVQGPLIIRHGF